MAALGKKIFTSVAPPVEGQIYTDRFDHNGSNIDYTLNFSANTTSSGGWRNNPWYVRLYINNTLVKEGQVKPKTSGTIGTTEYYMSSYSGTASGSINVGTGAGTAELKAIMYNNGYGTVMGQNTWSVKYDASITYVTISYNANGGTNAPSAQTVEQGKQTNLSSVRPIKGNELSTGYSVTLQSNGGTCNPTSLTSQKETVYTFKNWNTNSSGTGTPYNAGAVITPSANMTLYAQYDAVTTNKSVLLPDCIKPGFSFRGWSTSNSEYIPVPKNYTPTSNVTLYAFYSEIKKLMKCKIGEEFVDVGSIKIRVGDQWENVYRINLRNFEGSFDEK